MVFHCSVASMCSNHLFKEWINWQWCGQRNAPNNWCYAFAASARWWHVQVCHVFLLKENCEIKKAYASGKLKKYGYKRINNVAHCTNIWQWIASTPQKLHIGEMFLLQLLTDLYLRTSIPIQKIHHHRLSQSVRKIQVLLQQTIRPVTAFLIWYLLLPQTNQKNHQIARDHCNHHQLYWSFFTFTRPSLVWGSFEFVF